MVNVVVEVVKNVDGVVMLVDAALTAYDSDESVVGVFGCRWSGDACRRRDRRVTVMEKEMSLVLSMVW